MKIKKKMVFLLAMVLVPTISACGNGITVEKDSTSKEKRPENTSVNVKEDIVAGGEEVSIKIMQYKPEIQEEMTAAINQYMELYPNVTISLDTSGTSQNAGSAYDKKIDNKKMPDIFNCAGSYAFEFYKDYLEDLTNEPWVEHANAGMLDLNTVDERVYGLPMTTEGMGLIINKAMFEAADVDVRQMDNYEKIEKGFAKLQRAIEDGKLKDTYPDLKHVVAVQGDVEWVLGNHAINICLSPEFNGDVFQCADAKQINFTYQNAYKDYIELQLKYSAAKDDYSKALEVDYDTAVNELLAGGKVACIQQGNWIYKQVEKIDKKIAENLVYLPAPIKGYAEDCIFSIVSSYWCVNKQSDAKKKEAAKHFLNWLYQSEEGKNIVVYKLGFTPVFDNYGDLKPSDPLTKNMMEYFENGKGISMVFQGCPGGEEYSQNFFGKEVKRVLKGEIDWDTLFEEAKKEWKKRANNR
ncbi:MAG: ABC transporter substrate-binding protein [Lachnospiraceae bacterium]|nr:ABC transporter substrate-binding protein [Lachnospiraceae bacterium]